MWIPSDDQILLFSVSLPTHTRAGGSHEGQDEAKNSRGCCFGILSVSGPTHIHSAQSQENRQDFERRRRERRQTTHCLPKQDMHPSNNAMQSQERHEAFLFPPSFGRREEPSSSSSPALVVVIVSRKMMMMMMLFGGRDERTDCRLMRSAAASVLPPVSGFVVRGTSFDLSIHAFVSRQTLIHSLAHNSRVSPFSRPPSPDVPPNFSLPTL